MPPTILNSGQEQRIGILTNPLSGTNRKGMKTLSETISKYPQTFHKNVQTPQDIYEALFDFANYNVDFEGGDQMLIEGTLEPYFETLSEFLKWYFVKDDA